MAQKPETVFKQRIMPFLKRLPKTWVVKVQQVSIRGTPDILMCVNGVFVALELKTIVGKVDQLQQYTIDKINRCGGYAFIVDPSNWERIHEFLKYLSEKSTSRIDTNGVML